MSKAFDFNVSKFPALPQARGLFVTGTDTGVGKTFVAGAVGRYLHRLGVAVEPLKLVASGCRHAREGLISSDAEFLAACCESRRTLAQINPVRYHLPLAPNVAAEREHRPVDLEAIFESYRDAAAASEALIVEGVGGLLCPLSDDFWVVHLARLSGLPLLIVARPDLGTINHTLLTIHAARSAGLKIAGVVINKYRPDDVAGDLAMASNPLQIAKRGGVKVLCLVPEEAGNSVEKAKIGPDTEFSINQVRWEELLG